MAKRSSEKTHNQKFQTPPSLIACQRSTRVSENIRAVRQRPDLVPASSLIPRADETTEQFYERCLADLRQISLEVAIPYHLVTDYEELAEQYSRMKISWAASFSIFKRLTTSEAALIMPLQRHVICTVRSSVRQQAGRCLGRALSNLIELHYPDFF